MEGDHIKINEFLRPLSWIYGLVVGIRNMMFDCGLLRSESFDIPVISVGNLTVGGTGKTPHSEYLVKLLQGKFQIGLLSRGYKRKTHGFLLANADTTMPEIGDEPFQMKKKFPDIHLAVDKNRRRGIHRLADDPNIKPTTDVIILDDAYQHRYVTPGISILLMDYHRLICFDALLPAGRLREHQFNKRRADIVIVTKCPKSITPMEKRGISRSLELYPWQKLFFSTFQYGQLYNLFDPSLPRIPLEQLKDTRPSVLLLTGIGSPEQMEYDLRQFTTFKSLKFSDHHNFKKKDIRLIENAFGDLSSENRLIITTEKDATRLMHCEGFSEEVRKSLYVLPAEVVIMNDEEYFNETIIGYVRKNSRNSTLLKRKNDNKS
ncbi:MAG: tetraacyldisaccharide 4'-kinase [Bacteroidaceae bacterium]|nr:tetraacyldisaccharide 4'-kinase [Bacteroidaceae bacterium]